MKLIITVKQIFLSFLLGCVLISNAQNKPHKNITNTKVSNSDNYFKWNNFSFESDYSVYQSNLIQADDEDKLFFKDTLNRVMPGTEILMKFKNITNFNGFVFDKVLLSFSGAPRKNDNYFGDDWSLQYLIFIKYFDSEDEVNIFYKKLCTDLTTRYGKEGKSIGDIIGWQCYPKSNIRINIKRTNNSIIVLVNGNLLCNYKQSLKFKYDYFNTSNLFKEIDASNSYRGLDFGTPIHIINKQVKLEKSQSKFSMKTNDSKYMTWNYILFNDEVEMQFDKNFKFAGVNLFYICESNDKLLNFYKNIKELLGSCNYSISNGYEAYEWYGKNIDILLIKEIKNENNNSYFSANLNINSIKFEPYTEKPY